MKAPGPRHSVARIMRLEPRCTRRASPGPHRIAKHNPPKRADNQIDRARVLEVRIHLPPAESPCLAGFRPPTSRSRAFPAGVRGGGGGAVDRDGRGAVTWRRLVGISLS